MVTLPHIWLPWWQTSTHLQSHADLRTFLTGRRKASTMESCLFSKSQPIRSQLWGATCATGLCQGLYYVSKEGVLWTKRGLDLSKGSMQLSRDGNRTHNTIHMLLHDPYLPLNNKKRWLQSEETEGILDNFEQFLSDKGTYLFSSDLERSEIVSLIIVRWQKALGANLSSDLILFDLKHIVEV